MCGRFTVTTFIDELLARFYIEDLAFEYTPRYNAAPMQQIPAIIEHDNRRRLGGLKWGLVPSWAKDEKIGSSMINARAETAAEKPAFRQLLMRKRCIIPADGFYEWQRMGANQKKPMRITRKDRSLFAMAGLYDTWVAADGRKVSTCTIITTAPNQLMEPIHDRMPVILRPEDEALWLNREIQSPQELISLLRPYPDEELTAYPVSPLVGNVRNDTPELTEEYVQQTLF